VIANDVTAHKEATEELSAAAMSVQETAICSTVSGIFARYKSLVAMVESRVNLLERSVEVHRLYCGEYSQCQEMIIGERQHLQRIQDGSWDSIATARQQLDQLQVMDCFLL